jgi:hypothetical protein
VADESSDQTWGSSQMAWQVAEERGHVGAPEVGLLEAEGKSYPFLLGSDGNRRDRRNLLLAEGVLTHRGTPPGVPTSFALWGSGGTLIRRRSRGGGAQPRNDFITRGQSSETHLRMASSFRAAARRAGFLWVHPSLAINRPMWSG